MTITDTYNGSGVEKFPVKVGIFGCCGRVGRRLCALSESSPELELVAAIAPRGHQFVGRSLCDLDWSIPKSSQVIVSPPDLGSLPIKPDVIIDFSAPSGTVSCVQEAAKLGIAMVIGTTGLSPTEEAVIKSASKVIPIIHAMNFSLGINLLKEVAATVTSALGEGFDIEIVEAHHNRKIDSPSGTALALASSICEASKGSRSNLLHGRQGQIGPRRQQEVGMHAMRLGGVVGDHTVHFGNEFERIELTHRAQNRDVFASGALRAAKWIFKRRPAMYSMADVLFNACQQG